MISAVIMGEHWHIHPYHCKCYEERKHQMNCQNDKYGLFRTITFNALIIEPNQSKNGKEQDWPGEITVISNRITALPSNSDLNNRDNNTRNPSSKNMLQSFFPRIGK